MAAIPSRPLMTPHRERQVAVLAHVDPRSVRNYIRGRVMRESTRTLIERALDELKLAALKTPAT